MADELVWAGVVRPRTPLVYLDLNHFICMARANVGDLTTPPGYRELLDAARSATQQRRALVVLSAQHLFEMSGIKDPRQRIDLADVMEELTGFHYLLGRPEIAQLEIEAGVESVLEENVEPGLFPLMGPSFGRAFGMRGSVKVLEAGGQDASASLREQMGDQMFEAMMRQMNRDFERHILEGPSDAEAELLRAEYGYAPEVVQARQKSRLDFELELSKILQADPKWRRGRLRDVVSGREIVHEWLDRINTVNYERVRAGRPMLDPGDARMREMIAAMPHTQVAISMKTHYHRNPQHRWRTCDVTFTDNAARAALTNSPELLAPPASRYLESVARTATGSS